MALLAVRFHASYDWIDSAGEWAEAFANPQEYAVEAARNAEKHGEDDISEAGLLAAIQWKRENV